MWVHWLGSRVVVSELPVDDDVVVVWCDVVCGGSAAGYSIVASFVIVSLYVS
jgi:hypothetical protein